jgi:acyl-[acyl-carrier-protein]-phospholipid O-acyltransferase/long-chain-fatty-acid--[acyl-carrier-protein] ligase
MVDLPLFPRAHAPWFVAWPALVIGRLLYNVRTRGFEKVPAQGGALIVSNHLSYVDVFALQLACPRPIRFVGHEILPRRSWFFRMVYKLTGTIPVSPANALETIRRVAQTLKDGELVLVFPEGGISRTGHLMKLQRGFEMMARKAGVPVLPVAHDGLWGSLLSF